MVGEDTNALFTDYVATSFFTSNTVSSGDISSLKKMYDNNNLTLVEAAATPGFNIEFNITGVSGHPRFIISRWRYDGSATHFVTIDIYNWVTSNWDQVRVFTNSNNYYSSMTMYTPINNNGDYVSNGLVRIRYYHHTSGNPAHDLHIDYIGVTSVVKYVVG